MTEIDNPPAFPIRDMNEHPGPLGLTMRDWFAGQALAGVLAIQATCPRTYSPSKNAELAYEMADAMLAARK
jgi:hypothetical protein